jgi:hypothetical protein
MKMISFIATSLLVLGSAFAQSYDAELSYYVFTNHGSSISGKMNLVEKDTALPISAAWFDWKCVAQKQPDGALLRCVRNDENVETKIYCNLSDSKGGRFVRIGKAGSFVSFEVRCTSEPPRKARKKVETPKEEQKENPKENPPATEVKEEDPS